MFALASLLSGSLDVSSKMFESYDLVNAFIPPVYSALQSLANDWIFSTNISTLYLFILYFSAEIYSLESL